MNFASAMQLALQVSDTDEFDRTMEQAALVALHEKWLRLLEGLNPVTDQWVMEALGADLNGSRRCGMCDQESLMCWECGK